MLSDRQCCEFAAATYDGSGSQSWTHLFPGPDVYVGLKKLDGIDLIACRGSFIDLDWVHDIEAVPVPQGARGFVHSGFYKGVPETYVQIKPLISQPVVIVGHSLGGAHAQYLGSSFLIDGIVPAKICCFGSPKAGYQEFADLMAPVADYTLYKNGPDFITDAAPTLPGFPWTWARNQKSILEIPARNELSLFAFHHIDLYVKGMPDA
jgi:hypothetical protein